MNSVNVALRDRLAEFTLLRFDSTHHFGVFKLFSIHKF
jgi:hypothetical protein